MGGSGGGLGAAANLKTLREEKRELCLLDVAIVVDDVPGGEARKEGRGPMKLKVNSQGDSQGPGCPSIPTLMKH